MAARAGSLAICSLRTTRRLLSSPPSHLVACAPHLRRTFHASRQHSSDKPAAAPQTNPTSSPATLDKGHEAYHSCLSSNKEWAAEYTKANPDFFGKSAQGQTPQVLWIGCSDSRVPESTILGQAPGALFVHRNIANVISPTDTSILSVVEFAVGAIKVKDIVVCGHTKCGGVNATLGNSKLGILDVWLQPMRILREKHHEELEKLEDPEEKRTALSRLNVQAGVDTLRRIPVVIEAMKERDLQVHGLIYNLHTGLLDDVETKEDESRKETRASTFTLQ
ncbi:hypothetical protein LTR95_010568 [Oleoguttula sp. CCFEE 5521]